MVMGSPLSSILSNVYLKDYESYEHLPFETKNVAEICRRHLFHKATWCGDIVWLPITPQQSRRIYQIHGGSGRQQSNIAPASVSAQTSVRINKNYGVQ